VLGVAMTPVPDGRHRAAAVAAIVSTAVGVVLLAIGVGAEIGRLLASAALLILAVIGAWYAVTRVGWRRIVGWISCATAIVALVIVAVLGERANATIAVAGVALLAAAGALGRWALGRDVRTLKAEPTEGTPVPAAVRPILFINPRSGDGKAERLGLARECRERKIEAVVLAPGDDVESLARDAVERGADVIGMAGGDGSQGIVASVAASCGVPMVVVPSGTRNHLALDLGLEGDDVVGALDAFGEAVERSIDLADVNGRAFVNNVSLGVYASIVRSPEYRAAKVETTLSTLPTVLGPGSAPFDLSFAGPDGRVRHGARLVQVSNNPYGGPSLGLGSRPRLDTHRLGVISLEIDDDRGAMRFLSALAERHPERFHGFAEWTPTTFEVTSESRVDVGLDGEPMTIEPPLRFSIRPEPLHVRIPIHAIGASPAGRRLDARSAARGLWRVARGKPPMGS
jgi:diacylglycerol kinase family enzyme